MKNITHWKALKFVVFISDKMTGDRGHSLHPEEFKGKVVSVQAMKPYNRRGGTAPLIPSLGTRCR
jgi:hypothetical protein